MKYFGTDGIRGRAGDGMLSPENVQRLGVALGGALAEFKVHYFDSPVILGRDTRASGPAIAQQLTTGLRSTGLRVVDVGVVPTPAVAFLARRDRSACGVVISASHNPAHDNGIKLFGPDGYKVTPEFEQCIEDRFDALSELPAFDGPDDMESGRDRIGAWINDLVARGGGDGVLSGLSCMLDCANGAASEIAPIVFRRLGAKVETHFAHSNGTNINDGCGAVVPEILAAKVRDSDALLGFIFDGDADRMMAVDENGNVCDGDCTLAILARRLHATNRLYGNTVVGTIMSNLGLELSLREVGINLERTKVGDKHVSVRMRENGFVLGGEPSGHILYYVRHNDHPPRPPLTTGDGILAAILLARALRDSGEPLSKLSECLTPVPQISINVAVQEKPELMSIDEVRTAVETAEAELGDQGRIVLRYSGTEPLARVMIEGQDLTRIEGLANNIAEKIRRVTR